MSARSRAGVSIDDWDRLAPLSTAEAQHVAAVEQRAQEKPVPPRLIALLPHPTGSRPSTPQTIVRKGSRLDLNSLLASPSSNSRPQSAAASRLPNHATDSLSLAHPIVTTQQFHDWFAQVEASLEREQEDVYRTHLAELEEYLESCETVLAQLDDARGLISEMEANYRFVEDNSRALQQACETMLDEQKHLIEVTEALGARLDYFRELESATRMLNLPGETLVLQEDFLNMLDRLDVCLEYLKANRDFKDAEIYIVRFQQCLTRAMTLIKMYFITIVRRLTSEVSERTAAAGPSLSETAVQALLYTKFAAAADPLKVLVFELEKRALAEPSEYGSLKGECCAAWFSARLSLLAGPLAEEVRRMDPGATDLIKLARAGCNHLRGVAMSEWSLAKTLFASGEPELYAFLGSLCDYLWDSLRPRILHEPRLEVLCELCTVLTAMMALDATPGADSDSDTEDGLEGNKSVGRLKFSLLLKPVLQDAQTRLVFRAQAVVQAEVLYYTPVSADLDYPAKLEGNEEAGLALWTEDERLREAEVGGFRCPRTEVMRSWYPTLRKTVWVLSKLNTYVNNAIFEDFAGEAVTLCHQSLSSAATVISARPGNTALDGQLFLVRHLLLLKEMLRSVDLVHIERAADFSSVTDAFVNLLRNSSVIFNPNALFELASRGMPSFGETMTDAKTDLDNALKRTCEALIADAASSIALPIRAFLDHCAAYLSSSAAGKDLPAQSWAAPDSVSALHDTFQEDVVGQVQVVAAKLALYLNDEKTIGVLFPPLLDELVETYSTFYNLTRSEYGFATSSSLLSPATVKERLFAASSRAPT